jgi:hypothetical protein
LITVTLINLSSTLPVDVVSGARVDVDRVACLEVRGGNRSARYSTQLRGLNAWVSCRPLQPATIGGDLFYMSVCSGGAIARVTIADFEGTVKV